MAVREGLSFESAIESDCAPLAEVVLKLIEAGIELHCLRDLTRGGWPAPSTRSPRRLKYTSP
jgi:hydrogenase expression/formation protein HypE